MSTLLSKVLSLLLLSALGSLSQAAELRVGAAAVPVSPPTGWPGGPTGVHDELHAKALVLEKDGYRAAMVICDLVVLQKDVLQAAREIVARETGIPADRVMISGTHVHSAFDLPVWWTWETAPPVMLEWRKSLAAKMAAAVRKANDALVPARVWAGKGREDSLSFNRRFLMRDGTARMNPGKMNPDIVRPLGPIDPEVPVVYIDTPEGKPLTTFVNFAMHLDTVGGKEISADYPYTLAKILGDVKGPGMLTIFSIGAAGNVNHIDVTRREPQRGHGEAARIGAVLAGEVLKTYKRMQPVSASTLRAGRVPVRLPLPEIRPGDIEKAEALAARMKTANRPTFLEQMFMQRILETRKREGRPVEVEVQAVAVGEDLAWVFLPSEIFTEIGLGLKQASPFPNTIVSTLACDWIRYVPDRKGYAEGGYEAINTRGAAGSGELLLDAATRLLLDLRRLQ